MKMLLLTVDLGCPFLAFEHLVLGYSDFCNERINKIAYL